MKNIFILVFLVYTNIMAGRNELTLKYKYNEPLLSKGHYLIVSDIPVPTYPNTVGYFSNGKYRFGRFSSRFEVEKFK